MSVVADVLTWVFLLTGALFTLIGGIGVLRMPDLFARLHASGVSDMLGAGFVLIGLMFQTGWSLATVKLLLLLGFFAFTSPTAAHVVAKCALHSGLLPWTGGAAGERAWDAAPDRPGVRPEKPPPGEGEPSTR